MLAVLGFLLLLFFALLSSVYCDILSFYLCRKSKPLQ